ncbi:MAG: hypothetical protein LQ343_005074 [Gyalolechia ehrenbergii]|nr:MAG: hypothetical protein LQ343_005074 [Gyalolechia ehrenbergii]
MADNVSLDDNSSRVMIAVGFAIGITCVAIALRLLARRIQKVPLGADDFVILAGAIFTIGTAVTFFYSGRNGAGRHIKAVPPDQLVVFWKATYAGYQTYGVAVTLIKLSIILFYRRIFSTSQFRLRTNIVGALVIAWLFINNLMAAFQCRPIKKAWTPLMPGHCIDPLGLIIGLQAGNLALDIIILSLPVYAVSKLQMSLPKKIGVLAIFLLGGLSVVIAAIRIVVVATADEEDVTWYSSIESWTAVEPAIEVLSVSLPCMAPFLHARKAFKAVRSTLRSLVSKSKRSDLNHDGDFQKIDQHRKMMFDVEHLGQDNGGENVRHG